MTETVQRAVRDRFVLIGLLRSAGAGRAVTLVVLLALQALAPAATALLLGQAIGEIRADDAAARGVAVPSVQSGRSSSWFSTPGGLSHSCSSRSW